MRRRPSTSSAPLTAGSASLSPTRYAHRLLGLINPGPIPILLPSGSCRVPGDTQCPILLQVAVTEKLHLLLAELRQAKQ